MQKKEFLLNNNLPHICTPLTGNSIDEIISELMKIVPKKPDILEWRADFFNDIHNTKDVLAALQSIHEKSNGIPLLFTIRSFKEGGQKIILSDEKVLELLCEVCKSENVEMVDYELNNQTEHIEQVKKASNLFGKTLILSHHNFIQTPNKSEIINFLSKMASVGADVAKIAVMPQNHDDVITLLEATKEAKRKIDIPLITISMGDIGFISRVLGWIYGSSVTFAVGEKSSAPGQISIENLRKMVEVVQKQR